MSVFKSGGCPLSLSIAILLLLTAPASAAECRNIRVLDGDTLRCDLYLEFGIVLPNTSIRVKDFDAWESARYRRENKSFQYAPGELAKGALAKAALQKLLAGAKVVTALEPKDVDPHSRQLAWVYADGKEIGAILREQGHERKNP